MDTAMIGPLGHSGERVGGKVATMRPRYGLDLRRLSEDFDGRATLSTLDQVLPIRVGRHLRGGRAAPDEARGVRPGVSGRRRGPRDRPGRRPADA